ncbi:hypothetical protein Pmar_PMAR006991 [Perkinsus marinus ATCC 50983]|uniref:Peptidase A1 domain-containing protein n=1 Tax=Perkinsus marinus (strain ATCC 50983 / TXsc) TaxID=423536 RepID=C5KK01_PERM5|nr:hypothetical protein Pmar_PMAR006991 [Perkinsus marinus ATCC 50983]EER15259.1 hypothetical protein Pmar_PMAR006991 [Perkinsus marinus ATCC 50983]|eukprot:XP_002783463.1 hypothetical protein Pmar_PMAR006991 [Perkinsus marinus ATCC 50983]
MSSITRVLTPVIIFIQWLVYAEVYLPIEGGSVVMEFDGQKQRLTVDTGSQVLFVVYKECDKTEVIFVMHEGTIKHRLMRNPMALSGWASLITQVQFSHLSFNSTKLE